MHPVHVSLWAQKLKTKNQASLVPEVGDRGPEHPQEWVLLKPVPTWVVRILDFFQLPLGKCLAEAQGEALMIWIIIPCERAGGPK